MAAKGISNGSPQLQYTPVEEIEDIVDGLKKTFLTGKTRDIKFRIDQIKQVGFMVQDHEKEWMAALEHDLGRPGPEAYMVELNLIYADCKELVSKLPRWSKPQLAETDMTWKMTRPKIYKEPKGTVLVIGPFNYPVSLCLPPLMAAIAGGNCVVVKPSEQTPAVATLMARLLPQYVDQSCYRLVNGAKDQMVRLLDIPFDHIFFTGSGGVGKIVASAAGKHLCPVTLELGGKSPTLIFADADIKKAAKRVAWGKQVNAAQTCIAPDYVLCPKSIQPQFIDAFKQALKEFHPKSTALESQDFCHLVSPAAFDRLDKAMSESKGKVVVGGDTDKARQRIDISVFADVSLDDSLMQQELFGPILPIVTCETKEEAVRIINSMDTPLVLYCFTKSTQTKDYVFNNTRSGAFLQNDTLVHFAIPGLPFGGTGAAGYGNYHGKRSFDTFVHERAFVNVPYMMEPAFSLRYPPYTENKLKWYRRLLGSHLNFSRPTSVSAHRGFFEALLGRFGKLRWLIVAVAALTVLRRRSP